MKTYFEKHYYDVIVPALLKKFGYKNIMQVPRIEKVVLNMGVGRAAQDSKEMDFAVNELTQISGQKPVITKAKNSIAGFKLREGMPIGCKVTLRGAKMYEFLERFIHVALPRARDFQGISKRSFDGHGNFSYGIKEQIIFSEINYDKIDKVRGMNLVIVTSADTDQEARELLHHFNFPFIGMREKDQAA